MREIARELVAPVLASRAGCGAMMRPVTKAKIIGINHVALEKSGRARSEIAERGLE